ncbi:MAG: hypothetical protein AMXMBFR58_27950 [Phycisphaerae bacterium]
MSHARRCLLENDLLRAEIDHGVGASLTDLAIKGPRGHWWPLLRRSPAIITRGEDSACYLLAPWSNRIDGGVFSFRGEKITVRTNWPDGTAIHGDVRNRPWRILDRSPLSARLRIDSRDHPDMNWPWSFCAQVRYEVSGGSLVCDLTITNAGEKPMPAGGGFHPFFNRVLWDVADDPVVRAAVTGRYPCERVMVVGPATREKVTELLVAGGPLRQPLDDIFDCPTGEASIQWPASGVTARFTSSEVFKHLVVFCPIRESGSPFPFFCVEPVSMVNNGFNLAERGVISNHGVRVLDPGESVAMSWTLDVSIAS